MDYQISPALLSTAAPVLLPADAVDKYMKLLSDKQLRALIFIYRHAYDGGCTDREICRAIGAKESELPDMLEVLAGFGLLVKSGEAAVDSPSAEREEKNEPKPQPKPEQKSEPEPKKEILPPLPVLRPSVEQVVRRAKESEEIRFLFNAAQQSLGRTLGYDSQTTLLMAVDQFGLPVEVLLMLIDYCVSVGKTSMSYISRVASDWGEKEIDTIEKADKKISALRTSSAVWSALRELTGIETPKPTAMQLKYLGEWTDMGFDTDMIYLAYEEMANHTEKLSFGYMNKVLLGWHANGVKTPEDVKRQKEEFAAGKGGKAKGKKKSGETGEASYDLDEFTRRSLNEPVVYKK